MSVDAQARQRVLAAARGLLDVRGPNVTLFEVAAEVGFEPPSGTCSDERVAPVASLLELRFEDVVALVDDLPGATARSSRTGLGPHGWTRTGARTWKDAVGRIVAGRLDHSSTLLETVARELAVSRRTLQRRLADEGTTWRAVIDATRRIRATELLQQEIALDAVATSTGYSSSRALRRAVARWQREQDSHEASSTRRDTQERRTR